MLQHPQTAELMKLAGALPELIRALDAEIEKIAGRMAELDSAGLIYATEHWRKGSDGNPKYFYLLYPQQPGEPRRREYVGCDTVKIEDARAGIQRAKEYDELAAHMAALAGRVQRVQGALCDACRYMSGSY